MLSCMHFKGFVSKVSKIESTRMDDLGIDIIFFDGQHVLRRHRAGQADSDEQGFDPIDELKEKQRSINGRFSE